MSDVLLLQAARFGDLVQTRRLIKSLESGASAHLLVDVSLVELARLLYPAVETHGLYFHGKIDSEKLEHNKAVLANLREYDFKEIYNLNFSPLTAALCRLFEPEKVLGYRPCDHSVGGMVRSPWARFAFRLTQKRAISSLNLEDFWAYFVQGPIEPALVNPLPKAGGKGIGVVCAGRQARRSLSVKALAGIMGVLNKILHKPPFILFGAAEERPIAKSLLHALSGEKMNIQDLTGRTTLVDLGGKLEGLDLLLTPDTGLMHYAAFLGVPVMAFFMSSAWAQETAAYGEGHYIWQSAPACAPCLENAPCPHGEKCKTIFESPEFARLFTQFMLNPDRELDFPPDLQLWKSAFDECGQALKLVRGQDRQQEGRKLARGYMAAFLGFSGFSIEGFSPDWISICGRLLCPPDEWMLPPERYC